MVEVKVTGDWFELINSGEFIGWFVETGIEAEWKFVRGLDRVGYLRIDFANESDAVAFKLRFNVYSFYD
ncbi:MAG TPA: hypothetical protein VIY47_06000 [Ignavibacteriaceae bacterium]